MIVENSTLWSTNDILEVIKVLVPNIPSHFRCEVAYGNGHKRVWTRYYGTNRTIHVSLPRSANSTPLERLTGKSLSDDFLTQFLMELAHALISLIGDSELWYEPGFSARLEKAKSLPIRRLIHTEPEALKQRADLLLDQVRDIDKQIAQATEDYRSLMDTLETKRCQLESSYERTTSRLNKHQKRAKLKNQDGIQ